MARKTRAESLRSGQLHRTRGDARTTAFKGRNSRSNSHATALGMWGCMRTTAKSYFEETDIPEDEAGKIVVRTVTQGEQGTLGSTRASKPEPDGTG